MPPEAGPSYYPRHGGFVRDAGHVAAVKDGLAAGVHELHARVEVAANLLPVSACPIVASSQGTDRVLPCQWFSEPVKCANRNKRLGGLFLARCSAVHVSRINTIIKTPHRCGFVRYIPCNPQIRSRSLPEAKPGRTRNRGSMAGLCFQHCANSAERGEAASPVSSHEHPRSLGAARSVRCRGLLASVYFLRVCIRRRCYFLRQAHHHQPVRSF